MLGLEAKGRGQWHEVRSVSKQVRNSGPVRCAGLQAVSEMGGGLVQVAERRSGLMKGFWLCLSVWQRCSSLAGDRNRGFDITGLGPVEGE